MTPSNDYRGSLTSRLVILLFITVERHSCTPNSTFDQKSTDSSTVGGAPFSCERVQRRWERSAKGWEDEKASAQVKAGLFLKIIGVEHGGLTELCRPLTWESC